MRGVARTFGALAALAAGALLGAAGCEALVPSDLPAFSCTPGAAGACPSRQVCSPAGVCVNACPQTPCTGDLVCDPTAHICVPSTDLPDGGGDPDGGDATLPPDAKEDAPPLPDTGGGDTASTGELGAACQTTAQCATDLFCGSDSVLGSAVATTGPLCTKTCCKSEDCPQGFVCYGPGTGGTYCVRPALLVRKTAVGASRGGVACTGGETCRSGVCLGATGAKTCADTCCADVDCQSPAVCRRTLVEGHNVFACFVPPAGTTGNDTSCSVSSDCTSNMCVNNGINGSCKPHGCGKASCLAQTPSFGTCSYLQTSGAPEYLGACLHNSENPGGSPGAGAVGATCDPTKVITSDCKTSFCEPATRKCTDVCCVDLDCAPYAGTKCRPSANPHYLTCQ